MHPTYLGQTLLHNQWRSRPYAILTISYIIIGLGGLSEPTKSSVFGEPPKKEVDSDLGNSMYPWQ